MTRIISCVKCGTHLGEIRDAKLRIGIVFMCQGCNKPKPYIPPEGLMGEFFDKVFGKMN